MSIARSLALVTVCFAAACGADEATATNEGAGGSNDTGSIMGAPLPAQEQGTAPKAPSLRLAVSDKLPGRTNDNGTGTGTGEAGGGNGAGSGTGSGAGTGTGTGEEIAIPTTPSNRTTHPPFV